MGKKLEEVNSYLEQQHQEYEMKMAEKENRLTAEKNKLQVRVKRKSSFLSESMIILLIFRSYIKSALEENLYEC